MTRNRRYILPMLLAAVVTLPGVVYRLVHLLGLPVPTLSAPLVAGISGLAVLGASFLLLWACDAAQEDISQTLALAIVALIAVLPEYAVDMYITWQAGGTQPDYARYAIANMTGANRLIIGAAWAVVVILYWWKTRRAVQIEAERRTELFFLGLATLMAIFVALKGTLVWYDGLIFIGIYTWYMRVAGRRPCVECAVDGPAELLLSLPVRPRRLATVGCFLFAALVIGLNAAQFTEGLIATGAQWHIPQALLIQWLAPIASEAPEFTVAIMFTLRKRAGLALGSLLSSNLNQWTLLVGMIPFAYALSHLTHHGSWGAPLPMTPSQVQEIMITAAQSFLGIMMLATLRLSLGQVLLLLGLFVAQLALPPLLEAHPAWAPFGLQPEQIHPLISLLYFTAAAAFFVARPDRLRRLPEGVRPDASCALPERLLEQEDAVAK